MKFLPSVLAFAFLFLVRSALGYGNAGHEAVGNVAAHYLQGTRAETELNKILRPGETLAKACTWADRAKLPDQYLSAEMKEYVANNPNHHAYHFCDVPFQEKTYHDGGTGTSPDDIVHIMKLCIEVLTDPKVEAANPRHFSKRVAVLLLAHLAGDLHQPLHVGCSYVDAANHFVDPDAGGKGQADAGANDFKINKSMSLHGYWDTITVKKVRDRIAGQEFSAYLIAHSPPQPGWKGKGPPTAWPQQWATDTLHLAAQCYKGINLSDRHAVPADDTHPAHDEWKVTMPADYEVRAADIVQVELAKGGYRLAEIFKAIWP